MAPFFTIAACSPTRQAALRRVMIAHVAVLGITSLALGWTATRHGPLLIGNVALIAGIVEGALLIGWRLSQLPKSQALEFLLVSPLRPGRVFLAEALVGVARLAMITLAGLPILVLLVLDGLLAATDVATLLGVSFIWGIVAGLALTCWAYESPVVRRWGERVAGAFILVYLIVGVLGAEHLPRWLAELPSELGAPLLAAFEALHEYNPFGVIRFAMEQPPGWGRGRVQFVELLGLGVALGLLLRGAARLHPHFQEWHYRPAVADQRKRRAELEDRPLTWWAVARVSRYSGRINLWLAGGFGALYAVYTLFEADWPDMLGRQVFVTFENLGGVPMLTTALVLLAAVPAAFQYGLWDANAQDRCRRLELLLLTQLDGHAYWHAAASAAWRRGRGYFLVALILWSAAAWEGKIAPLHALGALAASVLLWGLYFALGFRAFTRGAHANGLGLALTLVTPIATGLLFVSGQSSAAALLPPGAVFAAAHDCGSWWWIGPALAGVLTLVLAQITRARCDVSLRNWYERHHGAAAGGD